MRRVFGVIGNVLAWTLAVAALLGICFIILAGTSAERSNCENAGGVYITGGMFSGASCAMPPAPAKESTQ